MRKKPTPAPKKTVSSANKRPAKVTPVKAEPKKRIETKPSTPTKMVTTKNGLVEVKVKETKSDGRKYVKVLATESIDRFKEMGERVFKKELRWAYYATENSVGAHYYLIINTVKI